MNNGSPASGNPNLEAFITDLKFARLDLSELAGDPTSLPDGSAKILLHAEAELKQLEQDTAVLQGPEATKQIAENIRQVWRIVGRHQNDLYQPPTALTQA